MPSGVQKQNEESIKPRIGQWEEVDGQVHLLAVRCRSCGEIFFPARQICLRCRDEQMEQLRLAGPARLTNATVIHQLPAGFSSPMVAGYGEFEPGVTIFAPIDADPGALNPGTTLLEVHLGPIRVNDNGEPLVAYRFRPAPAQMS